MTEAPAIQLTEKAAERIRGFLADRTEVPPLRFALVRSHCMGGRGHAYDLRVAEDRAADDVVVESRGITFVVSPASADRLRGVELDFVETLQESGFAVNNPNAVGKCPCGHHDLFA